MKLIGQKDDFTVYFSASKQKYFVYKGERFLIGGFRFSDVKSYLNYNKTKIDCFLL